MVSINNDNKEIFLTTMLAFLFLFNSCVMMVYNEIIDCI